MYTLSSGMKLPNAEIECPCIPCPQACNLRMQILMQLKMSVHVLSSGMKLPNAVSNTTVNESACISSYYADVNVTVNESACISSYYADVNVTDIVCPCLSCPHSDGSWCPPQLWIHGALRAATQVEAVRGRQTGSSDQRLPKGRYLVQEEDETGTRKSSHRQASKSGVIVAWRWSYIFSLVHLWSESKLASWANRAGYERGYLFPPLSTLSKGQVEILVQMFLSSRL